MKPTTKSATLEIQTLRIMVIKLEFARLFFLLVFLLVDFIMHEVPSAILLFLLVLELIAKSENIFTLFIGLRRGGQSLSAITII